MNATVPATRPSAPRPAIMAGGPVAALVPQSLDEAFRVAQAIAASGLAPKGLDKPEQVMVAIMAGAELGLAPFQALQSFAIVNNRPTLWGDGLMAVARAQGIKAREWIEGEGESATAHCEVTRPDTGETILRAFSVADAKKASLWNKPGPWQQYPKRMLQMRARAWALRDGCADILRGFQVREEVDDYQSVRDVTPRPSPGIAARLADQTGAREGFSAVHAGLDPEDKIPDFDAASPGASEEPASDPHPPSDAGHILPDDAKPSDEGDAAGSAEASADEGTGPAASVVVWADRLIAELPFMAPGDVEKLEGDRHHQGRLAMLQATDAEKAAALKAALGEARGQ